ncbi:MAG: ion transporter [Chloroflexota bacterium]
MNQQQPINQNNQAPQNQQTTEPLDQGINQIFQVCRRLTKTSFFQSFILGIIILAGIVVGIETNVTITQRYGAVIDIISTLILLVFVIEAILKILAEGHRPWNYFTDAWNLFDFSIVVLSLAEPLLTIDTSFIAILRLARILRVLRLITAIPDLRLLVSTLLRSVSSIAYVGLFLLLLFYMFGTMGVFLFRDNDPRHFSDLGTSMLSLYRVVTLEDWTDIMYINLYGCDLYGYDGIEHLCTQPTPQPMISIIYFVVFVTFGTMIILNLFIGVIMTSMDQAKDERDMNDIIDRKLLESMTIQDDIHLIQDQLEKISIELNLVVSRIEKETLIRENGK